MRIRVALERGYHDRLIRVLACAKTSAMADNDLIRIAQDLKRQLRPLVFGPPVTHVYCPLEYAWKPHREYLERYGGGRRDVVMLGMNPGPWGMAQTGVPFGEVSIVRDWLEIDAKVDRPELEHPKRPIEGFLCKRSEVSGARLWGWIRDLFGEPRVFFERFFIANYCPLVFMEESGKNRTPDKLPPQERAALTAECHRALRRAVESLQPRFVVGVGNFAEDRAKEALEGLDVKIGRILHPSPASPLANSNWCGNAEAALEALGIELPRRRVARAESRP
jgi:single-strand selective monofunctional uracil DNA glycosylase